MARAEAPLTTPHPKQAADRLLERAHALADLDAPEQACNLATAVLDTALKLRSERLTRSVTDLRANLGHTVTAAEALDARLAAVYEQE
ncbi:MAG: hypothetical protein ACRDXX_18945 [Stackebrandtia sp.]